MSATKKKKKPAPLHPILRKLLATVRGPARPLVLSGLVAAVLLGGWCAAWYLGGVREYVYSSGEYLVTPRSIQITALPSWIHCDIRNDVFRGASLDGPMSILDRDLTERISNAFSLHPWVEKVHRVRKHHPSRVEVELAYRQPACMVAVPGGLRPVDTQGVLLPRDDFTETEASQYPQLVDVDTLPVGLPGERWGDPRVVGGAQIAAALSEAWGELKLARILPLSRLTMGATEEFTYSLVTRGGTRIFWGRAPGSDVAGELSAADKVALLKQYVQQNGTLEGHDGPQDLDLYSLRVSSR